MQNFDFEIIEKHDFHKEIYEKYSETVVPEFKRE
jgi:hypothetical protein